MTETIKTLLQPIQERLDDALMHQTLDPADYADMAWKTTPDTARLLAAVQAVLEVADRWEEDFPHKAWQIRSALSKALTEAR